MASDSVPFTLTRNMSNASLVRSASASEASMPFSWSQLVDEYGVRLRWLRKCTSISLHSHEYVHRVASFFSVLPASRTDGNDGFGKPSSRHRL